MLGLILAMAFSHEAWLKEAWKDLRDIVFWKISGLKGSVIKDYKILTDENMLPSRFRYRQELADDLQKNGLEITDVMLAELDVWEHPVKGLAQGATKIKVSQANTMIAERMLGYGEIK